ncbi:MAG: hypothetical protein C4570_03405 [Ammonifex sp.]|nr:MAG: hypothetical protein C4570_03405 [Ammonifex sp.]
MRDDPLGLAATAITVAGVTGADVWGMAPRFQAGRLAKIESEYVEIAAANSDTNVLTAVRGRNGSTAAAHALGSAIYSWRAPEPVQQACIIQAVRQLERGFQGFGEARANADLGQMFWIKSLDPEAKELLQMYVW